MNQASADASAATIRLRGTILAVAHGTMTLRLDGSEREVQLDAATRIARVTDANLGEITPGVHVATVTKHLGPARIALELLLLPTGMADVLAAGRYAWDARPDTTIPTETMISPLTINGAGNALAPGGRDAPVAGTMTAGTVRLSTVQGLGRQLLVAYPGGEDAIQVPPTAPIASLVPGAPHDLVPGASVFVLARPTEGRMVAVFVAAGSGTLVPPL